MKRILYATFAVALALSMAGCAQTPAAPANGVAGRPAPARPTTATIEPATWKAMPLGDQEGAKLQALPRALAAYAAAERKARRTPADPAAVEPRFVGYQVQIWALQPDGRFQSAYIDVIGGRVEALMKTSDKLESRSVGLTPNQAERFTSGVLPRSAGEKQAVAKGVAWANESFPGPEWSAEIAGYDFYFGLSGDKYLVLTANASSDGYRVLTGSSGK